MHLDVFPTGPFQANCVLIGDESANVLAVIDPGDEGELIVDRVRRSGLEPTMILHTHGHLDHASATGEVRDALGEAVPVGLHPDEIEVYRRVPEQGRAYGVPTTPPPEPDLWLNHGDRLRLGAIELEVRHTPGHSPGGVSFVVHGGPEPLVIVGDALFAGSIGRTDLPGGSFDVLQRSILEQLYTLQADTRVVCGHGPDTTIGREKNSNPFVRGS